MANSYMPGIYGMFGESTVREYAVQQRDTAQNYKSTQQSVRGQEVSTFPWPAHFLSRYIL